MEKIIIKNDDGTEVEKEFFTAEDLEAKANETKTEYEKRIAEMESEMNPNWKEARKIMSEQEKKIKALEAQGKTIDDQGQVVDLKPEISYEEIERRAREAARSEQLNFRKEELLAQYDEETRKVVEYNYNKVISGEEVNVSNMGKFIEQAELLSGIGNNNPIRKAVSYGRGAAPNKQEPVDFADTDSGNALAEAMGLKYINRK